jgi:hypothetical protein
MRTCAIAFSACRERICSLHTACRACLQGRAANASMLLTVLVYRSCEPRHACAARSTSKVAGMVLDGCSFTAVHAMSLHTQTWLASAAVRALAGFQTVSIRTRQPPMSCWVQLCCLSAGACLSGSRTWQRKRACSG